MPYVKALDLLFIHIPKTGGTSFEEYILNTKNFEIDLHSKTGKHENLRYNGENLVEGYSNKSLQHLPYKKIIELQEFFNIDVKMQNVKNIMTFVRNPYERTISDLFWLKINKKTDTPAEIYYTLKNFYFNRDDLDYHNFPQYYFLLDSDNKIVKNINIIKTEDLTNSLQKIGFTDYNEITTNKSYMEYLNDDSIKIINEHFKIDFELFDYKMIDVQ